MDYSGLAQKLNIEEFYLSYLADKGRVDDEMHSNCPFHDDKKESFSVNLKTGLWKCFAPQCPQATGGNIVQFLSAIEKIPEREAATQLRGKTLEEEEPEPIGFQLINKHHIILLNNQPIVKFLQENCGYTTATIEKFKLGWDGERVWIPIIEGDKIVNIRKYSPKAKGTAKVKGIPGKNEMRIWPIENLESDEIYLFEGEKDCILANQIGLNGITVTGGAGSFKQEWVPFFKDKKVNVCYDIDKAGVEGAKKVASLIGRISGQLKIVNLPLSQPPTADFTNYIVDNGYTANDFKRLIEETLPATIEEPSRIKVDDEIHDIPLDRASHSNYFFKRVRIHTIVAGKDLAPYLIPKKIKVKCIMGKKICAFCGIGINGGDFERMFDYLSPDTLKLINCSDSQQEHAIRDTLRVSGNCMQYNYEIVEAQNIEELKLIPELDYSSDSKEYVIRTAYFMGHGAKSNQIYSIEAITMPHPQNQYATHLIYGMEESKSGIESFEMTEDIYDQLKIFQVIDDSRREVERDSQGPQPQRNEDLPKK